MKRSWRMRSWRVRRRSARRDLGLEHAAGLTVSTTQPPMLADFGVPPMRPTNSANSPSRRGRSACLRLLTGASTATPHHSLSAPIRLCMATADLGQQPLRARTVRFGMMLARLAFQSTIATTIPKDLTDHRTTRRRPLLQTRTIYHFGSAHPGPKSASAPAARPRRRCRAIAVHRRARRRALDGDGGDGAGRPSTREGDAHVQHRVEGVTLIYKTLTAVAASSTSPYWAMVFGVLGEYEQVAPLLALALLAETDAAAR